jgi:hypothetical protein
MIWGAPLIAIGLIVSGAALGQVVPQKGRPPEAPPAEPCDLSGQPGACSSCPSLLAALRLPGAPTGDNGTGADGIAWSPLYVAFRLNCPDAGRILLSRGTNPERGGKNGALLTEIATQHFAAVDQRPAVVQTAALEWVGLLSRSRPFDLDVPIGDGMPSTRTTWAAILSAGSLPPGSAVVWSRIVALSANFPVLAEGGERVNVDFPAPDTGITRPSETAVSRGVDAMLAAYERGGISEVTSRVQACWATPRPPALTAVKWRWHLDNCASMDVAAEMLDTSATASLGVSRTDFFLDEQVSQRVSALNQLQGDGLQPSPYVRSLRRSVAAWLPIQYAIRKKT